MDNFEQSMYELIVRTSTLLPPDVKKILAEGRSRELVGTQASAALTTIARNVDMAAASTAPICQDTGMPTFELHVPMTVDQSAMEEAIGNALSRATKEGTLRPNSVHSITGMNEGNGGTGYPVVHFQQWKQPGIHVRLILKGGGCENMNRQYSLPVLLPGLGTAGRDLDGVRKCILDAVYHAQGKGCSPAFLGVGIGGDRMGSYETAKAQLFRRADDQNPNKDLAALENYVMDAGNTLGIGTLGFGGRVSVLGCKVGHRNRLPACFFVSVAYNCWAYRRQGVSIDPETHEILQWDYHDPDAPDSMEGGESRSAPGAEPIRLRTPLSEKEVRSLKVGDVVLLSGTIHTGRDSFHKHHMTNDAPVDLDGGAIYHCGPVMLQDGDRWLVKAAGPTTSIREEPYQAAILQKFRLRAVIGKGGMGNGTLEALRDVGAVYLNAVGGAAQYAARCVKEVTGVHYLEFGIPEAMWHLEVEDFPVFVTMDSHGRSLHADVETSSFEKLESLAPRVF